MAFLGTAALMAAVSTATVAATTGAFIMGSWITHFLIATAMGAALNALAPKPSKNAGVGGYLVSGASGAALDHQVIYGETVVGGVRVYDSATGTDNKYLHRIMAFAGHEIDSYQDIMIDGRVVTIDGSGMVTAPEKYAGLIRIKRYYGTAAQTADADLITDTAALTDGKWTVNHRLQGIAYLYVRFRHSKDAYNGGVPTISAKIRGKKVYDPRNGTTVWNANAALCIRDYMVSSYGLSQVAARIDNNYFASAATVCDETVNGNPRYTCNGAFTTGAQPSQILDAMLSSMAGVLWFSQGSWKTRASKFVSPTHAFNEDDLRSGINLSTRFSRRDSFNSVKGTFRGPSTDWQETDYPEVSDPAYLSVDGGIPNALDLPLPFTTTPSRCERIANIVLRRNREQLTFNASFGLRAMRVQISDIIQISNTRFGWTNKQFEVTKWGLGLQDSGDIIVNMTLREISSAVFTDSDPSIFELNNTTLPDPYTGNEITNLAVTIVGATQKDGTILNTAKVTWDAVNAGYVDFYNLRWKPTADTVWATANSDDQEHRIEGIRDTVQYTVEVRAVNTQGNSGPWASTTFTNSGDITAPAQPSSISVAPGYLYNVVKWTNPGDTDFSHVEVYAYPSNVSGSATLIGKTNSTSFMESNLGIGQARWYFLRSVDFSGNKSALTSGVTGTTTGVPTVDLSGTLQVAQFSTTLRPIEIVSTMPTTGNFEGRMVYLTTTDGAFAADKVYRWTSNSVTTGTLYWTANVPTTDLSGTLEIAQFAANIRPVEIVGALPSTGNFQGRVVLLTTDNKMYRWTSATTTGTTFWTAAVPAVDVTGQLTDAQIAAVAAAKLTGQITSTQITDDAITTAKIAAGAITAAEITAGTITAGQIAADTITAAQIAAGAITANEIAANTITAGQIAADTITAGQIAAGAISATEIAADAIIASKIAVADFTNLVPDATLIDPAAWANAGIVGDGSGDQFELIIPTLMTGVSSKGEMRARVTGTTITASSKTLTVMQNDELYVYYQKACVSGNYVGYVNIRFADRSGALVSYANIGNTTEVLSNTTPVSRSGSCIVPVGAVTADLRFQVTGAGTTGLAKFWSPTVRLKGYSELLVDGAIKANNIDALAVTAGKIAADAVTAGTIQAGAVSADEIAAGSIIASKLAVADFTNLVPDSELTDDAAWTNAAQFSIIPATSATGTYSKGEIRCTVIDANNKQSTSRQFSVVPNQKYWAQYQKSQTGGSAYRAYAQIYWYDKDGVYISASSIGSTTEIVGNTSPALRTGEATAPANAVLAAWRWWVIGADTNAQVRLFGPTVRIQNGGELIVDGAISADKMAANSITAANAALGTASVETLKVKGNAITVTRSQSAGLGTPYYSLTDGLVQRFTFTIPEEPASVTYIVRFSILMTALSTSSTSELELRIRIAGADQIINNVIGVGCFAHNSIEVPWTVAANTPQASVNFDLRAKMANWAAQTGRGITFVNVSIFGSTNG
jgi:Fibronectin type III domain